MCMACGSKKVGKVSPKQAIPVSRGSARRIIGSSKYGTPKVKMSFGRRKA